MKTRGVEILAESGFNSQLFYAQCAKVQSGELLDFGVAEIENAGFPGEILHFLSICLITIASSVKDLPSGASNEGYWEGLRGFSLNSIHLRNVETPQVMQQ